MMIDKRKPDHVGIEFDKDNDFFDFWYRGDRAGSNWKLTRKEFDFR
jgi:hypothetical protein